ncbi:hypothetical protein CR513_35755, partial [Mucuna pruriens]
MEHQKPYQRGAGTTKRCEQWAGVQRQFRSRPKSKRGFRGLVPDLGECPLRNSQISLLVSLEERLHAIEGGDKYGLEVVDLCLIPNVGLLEDFKTLEFDKYKGSSCPHVHLAMYCRKMATYIYDNNLTGAELSWYVSLERRRIKT